MRLSCVSVRLKEKIKDSGGTHSRRSIRVKNLGGNIGKGEGMEDKLCKLEWIECEDGKLIRADSINVLQIYMGNMNWILLNPGIVAYMNNSGEDAVIIKKYAEEKLYMNSVGTCRGEAAAYADYQKLKEALIKGWKTNFFQVQFEFAEEIEK